MNEEEKEVYIIIWLGFMFGFIFGVLIAKSFL